MSTLTEIRQMLTPRPDSSQSIRLPPQFLLNEMKRLDTFQYETLPVNLEKLADNIVEQVLKQRDELLLIFERKCDEKRLLLDKALSSLQNSGVISMDLPIDASSPMLLECQASEKPFNLMDYIRVDISNKHIVTPRNLQLPEHLKVINNYYNRSNEAMSTELKSLYQRVLSGRSKVTTIKFTKKLKKTDWKHLGLLFPHTFGVEILDLDRKQMGYTGMQNLSPGLKHLTQLNTLNLRSTNIGDQGAKFLSESLGLLTNLTRLYLSANNIGPQGITFLSPAIFHLTLLQELSISANKIEVAGAQSFSAVIPGLISLRALNISDNNLPANGIKPIAEALSNCSQLQKFFVGGNILHKSVYGLKGIKLLYYQIFFQYIAQTCKRSISWGIRALTLSLISSIIYLSASSSLRVILNLSYNFSITLNGCSAIPGNPE